MSPAFENLAELRQVVLDASKRLESLRMTNIHGMTAPDLTRLDMRVRQARIELAEAEGAYEVALQEAGK